MDSPSNLRQKTGLGLGLVFLLLALLSPAPEGLSVEGWRAVCIGLMMGALWMTEALPIPVTAFFPLVLFPLLGVASMADSAAPYAHPVIFLFMGGFMLSLAMQRWRLHLRIALGILSLTGSRPHSILWGFILSTALLSMWVSNAATTTMMLPIGLSVVALLSETDKGRAAAFAPALMLAIGYSATIGGLGTPIGTPPNAFLVGHMSEAYGVEMSFWKFMLIGVPLMIVALPVMHRLLTRWVFSVPNDTVPGAADRIRAQFRALGPMGFGEKATAVLFASAALMWIGREWLQQVNGLGALSDTGIAMLVAILLFLVPVDFKKGVMLLDWDHAKKLPWDVLILFGGGLSLADAFQANHVAEWLGTQAGLLGDWPVWALVLTLALGITFLTEMTSNTATAAAFVPVAASLASGLGENPLLLAIPVALSASCAFMLPVATPPNAIVFGSGHISLPKMARAGIWLNFVFAGLITVLSVTLVRWVFGV